MKIRLRLTLLFTVLTASILLLFALVIYFSAQRNREHEFFELLKKEAFTKSNLFFNAKVDVAVLQEIYRSNREMLNEVEVAIYNANFNLLYHDAVEIDFVKETNEMLDEIFVTKEIRFYEKQWQVVGFTYEFQDETYLVTAAAYDEYGYNKLDNLFRNIVFVFVLSILVIFLAGMFFSKKAFEPVKLMTDRAKKISASNLDLRLNTSHKKDELTELANTFNAMLERLEHSFEAQKHFVSNISHELRTPLTALITELELSAKKDGTIEEYKKVIQNTLSDARKMVRLSNSILDLAKASYDPTEISFKMLRLDEIIWDARQKVVQANLDYQVLIHFDENLTNEDSDLDLFCSGNEYLLRVAFINLIENACKFSENKTCKVLITSTRSGVELKFIDEGIGIPEADLEHLFTPFYRGMNKHFADGNGIGLSLTKKIVLLHSGEIIVQSSNHSGTIFKITLPKANL
jgi:two-component system sensor histidine kinase ArlS